MAATPSLKVLKSFTYRGAAKTFSNRYHFNGGTPADSAHWTTLADNVVAQEKLCYASDVTIVGVIGYAAGSDVPVFTKSYSTAGTWSPPGGAAECPGDCAALIRYATTARTPKNHPVYLYNYYHGVYRDSIADNVNASQKTSYNSYGSNWVSGFSDGTNTYVRAGPNGATATGYLTEPFVKHRDFPT